MFSQAIKSKAMKLFDWLSLKFLIYNKRVNHVKSLSSYFARLGFGVSPSPVPRFLVEVAFRFDSGGAFAALAFGGAFGATFALFIASLGMGTVWNQVICCKDFPFWKSI